MKRNYHDYMTRSPMHRTLMLVGFTQQNKRELVLSPIQQYEISQEASDLDRTINTLATEATVLSRELDNAKKYIERLKDKIVEDSK